MAKTTRIKAPSAAAEIAELKRAMKAKDEMLAAVHRSNNDLKSALDKVTDDAEARLRAATQERNAERAKADAAVKDMIAENNRLRDIILDQTRELSRREGYLQAIEDAKPPRMMEVPTKPAGIGFDASTRGSVDEYDYRGDRVRTTSAWHHRNLELFK